MLTLKAVATTDALTSLHNPVLMVEWTGAVVVVAVGLVVDEQDDTSAARAHSPTTQR